MNNQTTVGVVGGGISGIATAYFLTKLGYSVEIIESESSLGGRVGCDYIGDRKIEFGGKNIGRNYPRFRKFVSDMGDFPYEFFGINTSSSIKGKKKVLDSEKPISTLFNIISMTGFRDFSKMAGMIRAIKSNPDNGYLRGPYFKKLAKTKDDKAITDHFGQGFCDNIIRPLTIRMNGCEPENYYLGNFGSNLKMIVDKYDQLEDGVYQVIEKFTEKVSVRTSTQVTGLQIQDNKVIGVIAEHNGNSQQLPYDAVVLCTPAPVSARITEKAAPTLTKLLSKINYNPVAIVVAKYKRDIFDFDVRAQVFGPEYALSNAGAYGINDRDIVRYTFSGTTANNFINEQSDPNDILALGEQTLNPHIPVDKSERAGFVYRFFRAGLCAYAPHHADLVDEMLSVSGQIQGLGLSGDYMRGAAIEACFYSAEEAVGLIKGQLANSYLEKQVG